MKRVVRVVGLFAAMLLCANLAQPAVSPEISYQAVLTQSGSPVTTPVSVTFTMYDDPVAGSVLWTETKMVTPDAQGRISTQLGNVSAFDDATLNTASKWLGITVSGDTEMSPRMKLASSSSSLRVGSIDGAKAGAISGDLRVTASASTKDAMAVEARVVLVGLTGDSIIIGPADQVILRAVDNLGAEVASMDIDPVLGPVLTIRDPGGSMTQHSGDNSSYYSNSAKSASALQKQIEIDANGVTIYGTDGTVVSKMASDGTVRTTGLAVETPVEAPALKSAEAAVCWLPNTGYGQGNESLGNNSIGEKNGFVTGAKYSMAIGGCNTVQYGHRNFLVGYGNYTGAYNSVAIGIQDSIAPGATGSTLIGINNKTGGAGTFAVGNSNWLTGSADASVALGSSNSITGTDCAAIGKSNSVQAPSSFAAGSNNALDGGGENICMGDSHRLNGGNSAILGGNFNSVYSGANTTISGGQNNVAKRAGWGIIGGGKDNRLGDSTSDVYYMTISGGEANFANSIYATVGGGASNQALAYAAAIAGGAGNISQGAYGAIAGGDNCRANGVASMVPGGSNNNATGDFAFAAGRRAKATHSGSFIWGDQTDADVNSERADQFRVRANGGARFDDDTMWVDIRDDGTDLMKTSSGAHLTVGGAWTNSSDVNLKENFESIDGEQLLAQIASLPIQEWNYKVEGNGSRHIGPTAQDFFAAFGLGGDDVSISTIDPAGVALAAIQALDARTRELAEQQTEIDALRAQLAELKQLVESMSHQR